MTVQVKQQELENASKRLGNAQQNLARLARKFGVDASLPEEEYTTNSDKAYSDAEYLAAVKELKHANVAYEALNSTKETSMKDYTALTDEELAAELEQLEESERQDNIMDGSGECGGMIAETYAPYYEAIDAEMKRRGMTSDEDGWPEELSDLPY